MKQYIAHEMVSAAPAVCIGDRIYEKTAPIPIVDEGETVLDGYKVVYDDGFESFCQKDYFERIARTADGMTFGLAIEAMKMGKKVSRRGWNGKGMYVIYRTGYPDGIPCNKNTADAVGIPEGTLFKVRPYLQMKCVDGSFQMWLASQSDILADDWEVVE